MDAISLPMAQLFIQMLGLPGLIFIIWHFDNKRLDKQAAIYIEEAKIDRDMYERDICAIKSLYSNNVHLVSDYNLALSRLEKISSDMMGVVALNAQASTQLADAIKNNTFCPSVRAAQGRN